MENVLEQLEDKQSVAEILDVAIEFERTAMEFFTSLIPSASPRLRGLIEELAEEEEHHYQRFQMLKDDPTMLMQLTQRVIPPVSQERFQAAIEFPQLGDNPQDQDVLEYAIRREQAAAEHYALLAEQIETGPLRSLLQLLAHEEAKHKHTLESIYAQLL